MVQDKPEWVLVLGTRLGEATSFWDRDLLPHQGFLHVDLDPTRARHRLSRLPHPGDPFRHRQLPRRPSGLLPGQNRAASLRKVLSFEDSVPLRLAGRGPVRPQILMQALQRNVVDRTDAFVLAECGNSFAWCNHYLRFDEPGRYRVSTLFGSMGHSAAGVVGAALASGRKAFAVVGDGAMLMNSEVSSAAQYQAQAVWIVLNDAGYGMCRDGQRMLGLAGTHIDFPQVDFVDWSRAQGADGVRVETEDMLELALAGRPGSHRAFRDRRAGRPQRGVAPAQAVRKPDPARQLEKRRGLGALNGPRSGRALRRGAPPTAQRPPFPDPRLGLGLVSRSWKTHRRLTRRYR